MSIGLKRGTVRLEEHQTAWEENAAETIAELAEVLQGLEAAFAHVGSTAVRAIKAKPIVDIAVAVRDFEEVLTRNGALAAHGIIFRVDERPEQLLYVKGDFEADTRTHHIHVVRKGSKEWNDYLALRDYLNADARAAAEYEAVKIRLAEQYAADREAYTEGKGEIIARLLQEAKERNKEM